MQLGAPQAEVYRLGPGDWWAAAISVPPTAAALDWVLSNAAQSVWDNNGMQARPASPLQGAVCAKGMPMRWPCCRSAVQCMRCSMARTARARS